MSASYPWLEPMENEFAERRKSGRMAHALLVSGPAHLGKLETALQFMESLLCTEETYPACGQCRSCQLMKSGAHPDGRIITFEPHEKTGVMRKVLVVDQVRRLISALQLTRTFSPHKVALIHPADAMTIGAANALLKTLEEPPGDSVLILVTSNPARFPATIRSRCQRLNARLPEQSQALSWLESVAGLDGADAAMALEAAAGRPLQALDMAREDGVDQYRLVTASLDALLAGSYGPGQAMAELSDVDTERLWSWLSLRSAREIRQRKDHLAGLKELSLLQLEADRNRALMSTPVRKDLLLQDWLIQWSRMTA